MTTDEIPSVLPRLVIEVLASGGVNVNGPINDIILSYGLLEMAKDAIRDNLKRQQQGPRILPISGAMLDMAEKRKMLDELRNGKPPP